MVEKSGLIPPTYAETLNVLKERIRSAQIKASLSVNEKLLELYWDIGKIIIDKQKEEGWGIKVIDRMARDLKVAFPKMTGFSVRNMLYMKQLAESYSDFAITQQVVAQIPWGSFLICYFCAYRKIGTKYLTFILISGPFSMLKDIVQGFKAISTVFSLVFLEIEVAFYLWWYRSTLSLRRLNKRMKLEKIKQIEESAF